MEAAPRMGPTVDCVSECAMLTVQAGKWNPNQRTRNALTPWSLTDISVCVPSHVCLFATPRTITRQAALSTGFPRQEYWSGLPCSPPGDLPNPGIELTSPTLAGRFFTTLPQGKQWISPRMWDRLRPRGMTMKGRDDYQQLEHWWHCITPVLLSGSGTHIPVPAARILGCNPGGSNPRRAGSGGLRLALAHWRAGPEGSSGGQGWPGSHTARGCWCRTPRWTGRSPPGLWGTWRGSSAYSELKKGIEKMLFFKILPLREKHRLGSRRRANSQLFVPMEKPRICKQLIILMAIWLHVIHRNL